MRCTVYGWPTNEERFTAKIEANRGAPDSVKLGLAFLWAKRKKRSLKNMNLEGAVLRKADLRNAKMSDIMLDGADLRGADLSGARLTGVSLDHANLDGALLAGANILESSFKGTSFVGACLSGAVIDNCLAQYSNFSDADFANANIFTSNFTGASFRHARFVNVDFSWVGLERADLSGADFAKAAFSVTPLTIIDAGRHYPTGNRFIGWMDRDGKLQLTDGNFAYVLDEAKEKYALGGYGGDDLPEVLRLIEKIEAQAAARGWVL